MIDFLKAGLEAQKQLLDLQAGQIRLFENMLKAGQAQAGVQHSLGKAAETQMKLVDDWLGLWGMKR